MQPGSHWRVAGGAPRSRRSPLPGSPARPQVRRPPVLTALWSTPFTEDDWRKLSCTTASDLRPGGMRTVAGVVPCAAYVLTTRVIEEYLPYASIVSSHCRIYAPTGSLIHPDSPDPTPLA